MLTKLSLLDGYSREPEVKDIFISITDYLFK